MATTAQRQKLVYLAHELIMRQSEIHYAQVRPMRTISKKTPSFPMTMDCSEAVTCLFKWAGLKDPNGRNYDGYGYTGTLLSHLRTHYFDPSNALPGALVVFGGGTGHHVCMVIEHGSNPLLFSHGQEAGPLAIRLSVEQQYQPAPATFLSIIDL
jgi:hypothetical protein